MATITKRHGAYRLDGKTISRGTASSLIAHGARFVDEDPGLDRKRALIKLLRPRVERNRPSLSKTLSGFKPK